MDDPPIYGKPVYRDLRPLARHFPSRLQVRLIGYLPSKQGYVERAGSDRLSFSFILNGGGEYRQGLRTWPVQAPCVVVQRPGVAFRHGPKGEWEELYINYARELVPVFEELRFLPADKPVWRAHDAAAMRRCAAEIVGALPRAGEFGRADLIDRLCERLILETLIGYIAPPAAEREKSVRGARAYIENHYREAIVFDELALDYGMSPSAFRRKWKELMPIPPAKYAMQLRIREACRLLAETGMKIGDVAREVGFADRLYFARCFRRAMGETASSYRAHCRRRGPFETGAGGAEGGASQGDLPGRGKVEESRRDRPRGEWPGAPQSRRAHGRKCKALERLRDRRAPGVYPPAPCEQDGH